MAITILFALCALGQLVSALPMNLNCGGPQIGETFLADSKIYHSRTNGFVLSHSTANITESAYDSYAYALWGIPLVYNFTISSGTWIKVTLRFSEIWEYAEQYPAEMKLLVDGKIVQDNVNVLKSTNNLGKHLDFDITYMPTRGEVEVRIEPYKGNAWISGITIEAVQPPQKATDASKNSLMKKPKMNSVTSAGANIPHATGILKVNCGGGAIADFFADQHVFYAETGSIGCYLQGNPFASIYNSMAFQNRLIYTFLVTPGSEVTVIARFAETYGPAASSDPRVMDVFIGGDKVKASLDVYQQTKSLSVPYDVEYTFNATTGLVEVKCVGIKQKAMISGIDVITPGIIRGANGTRPKEKPVQLVPRKGKPVLDFELHINCGGPALDNGIVADSRIYTPKMRNGIGTYVMGDPKNSTFNTHAYGKGGEDLVYTFNVTKGSFFVIHAAFAEIWKSANRTGARIMDVLVNNVTVVEKLDVFNMTGGLFDPYVIDPEFTACGTEAEIRMKSIIGDPMISAIHIESWKEDQNSTKWACAVPIPKRVPNTTQDNDGRSHVIIDTTK